MADLTPDQCAQLSFLASIHLVDGYYVQWDIWHGERHELRWRVKTPRSTSQWQVLFWSKSSERFNARLKTSDIYWQAAGSIQDVLKAGASND